jgi:hypothetical protein
MGVWTSGSWVSGPLASVTGPPRIMGIMGVWTSGCLDILFGPTLPSEIRDSRSEEKTQKTKNNQEIKKVTFIMEVLSGEE